MNPVATLRSPYEQRVQLVADTVKKYSVLDDAAATELAAHVLDALNSIPEKMR